MSLLGFHLIEDSKTSDVWPFTAQSNLRMKLKRIYLFRKPSVIFPRALFDITFPDFQSCVFKTEKNHTTFALVPRFVVSCVTSVEASRDNRWKRMRSHTKFVFFRKQQEQLQMALSELYFL